MPRERPQAGRELQHLDRGGVARVDLDGPEVTARQHAVGAEFAHPGRGVAEAWWRQVGVQGGDRAGHQRDGGVSGVGQRPAQQVAPVGAPVAGVSQYEVLGCLPEQARGVLGNAFDEHCGQRFGRELLAFEGEVVGTGSSLIVVCVEVGGPSLGS